MKRRSLTARMVRVLCGASVLAGVVVLGPRPAARADEEVVDPEVKKVMTMLSDLSRSPAERTALAKQVGKFDEDKGKPAARALCVNAPSSVPALRAAALESLQKVHPKLYPEVVTIVTDMNPKNHYRAQGALAKMGEEGNGAVPVILTHMKFHATKGAAAINILEEFLKWDAKEYFAVPILRRLIGLRGDELDSELRSIGWIKDPYVSASLTAGDMLVLSRIAPREKVVAQEIAKLLDHKSNIIRFSGLVALDACDVSVASAHQGAVKKHKLDNTKPIRELAVDLDKKFDAYRTTKELEKKP